MCTMTKCHTSMTTEDRDTTSMLSKTFLDRQMAMVMDTCLVRTTTERLTEGATMTTSLLALVREGLNRCHTIRRKNSIERAQNGKFIVFNELEFRQRTSPPRGGTGANYANSRPGGGYFREEFIDNYRDDFRPSSREQYVEQPRDMYHQPSPPRGRHLD